jgi:hypothetical protein
MQAIGINVQINTAGHEPFEEEWKAIAASLLESHQ